MSGRRKSEIQKVMVRAGKSVHNMIANAPKQQQASQMDQLPSLATKSTSIDRSTVSRIDKIDKTESAMNLSLESLGDSDIHDSTVVLCDEYLQEESQVQGHFE